MAAPIVVPRSQHTLSRRDIDPDALRVLYRLHQADFIAYLVGGSVRDVLLGRRPKDFDIGTSAHPYQVKKLFRNCWIIGRRFRLAHVKFGTKTIEVATFRRQVPAGSEAEPPLEHVAGGSVEGAGPAEAAPAPPPEPVEVAPGVTLTPADAATSSPHAHHLHHDNTFGTPEEDAFRRDFTVNALFYDIATFSVIDYTGGLEDLQARVIRCIGDPEVRFKEDPVRMLRAIVLAARLDFSVDPPIYEAIRCHQAELERSAQARLIEEYFKILRSGASARAFGELGRTGLLRHISPEIPATLPGELVDSLEALDAYRRRFEAAPESMSNAVLLGSLLVPLGLMRQQRQRRGGDHEEHHLRTLPRLGALPLPRKDVERLAHALALQPRLLDTTAPDRRQHGVLRRPSFRDALTWMEIHGLSPEVVGYWRDLAATAAHSHRSHAHPPGARDVPAGQDQAEVRTARRRRRRRGRGRGRGPREPQE
jgi:poly(A) polymerase